MNRKLFYILVLLFLLTGCGPRRQPDVEYFQGDVVATLQRPISQPIEDASDPTPPGSSETTETLLPSQLTPASTPGVGLTPAPSEPEPTAYPGNAGTATALTTPTLSLTQAPTEPLGGPTWGGTWNIWYQSANGGYTPAELTVQVDGTNLSASAKIEGIDFTFKGEIITEGSQVEGKWQTATSKGSFWWRMNAADTFVGSRENRFGFCGNRATTVQPNPCREVRQN